MASPQSIHADLYADLPYLPESKKTEFKKTPLIIKLWRAIFKLSPPTLQQGKQWQAGKWWGKQGQAVGVWEWGNKQPDPTAVIAPGCAGLPT